MSAGIAAAQAPGLDCAQVIRAEAGRTLTAASKAAPADIVSGFLRSRGRSAFVLASLRTTRSSPGVHGVTHLRMEQVVDGLTVHGAYLKAAVNARGKLVQVVDRLAEVSVAPSASRVDAAAALRAAIARVHPGQSISLRARGGAGQYRDLRWRCLLPHGADGRVLDVESRTASDSYNVFLEDPLKGPQIVVNGPSPGNALSPAGWLGAGAQTTNNISGNKYGHGLTWRMIGGMSGPLAGAIGEGRSSQRR